MSSSLTAKSIFVCIDLVRDEVFQRPVMMNRTSVLNRGGADDSRAEKKRGIRVKEKTIAARRSDVKTLIFPLANRRDFDELAANVKEGLDVHFVDEYSQIFDLAFSDDTDVGR
ncbi:hypothetical protein Droror1_Dr00001891 [Drosera rotundifolia]